MTDERILVGWGARDWRDLVAACDGMEAAWTDYGGFRVGELPTAQPPSSHVWAWSSDGRRLMRARTDGSRVIVGWLIEESEAPIERDARPVETVQVTVRPMRQWLPADRRVTLRGTAPRTLEWHAADVESADPVTFVWATHPATAGVRAGRPSG